MITKIKIKKLTEKAILPTRGHKTDAGLDLYCVKDTPYKTGEVIKVPTGIAIQIPEGYVGIIRDRSSVSLTGLKVTAGIIDSGYTGECNVALLNLSGSIPNTSGWGCIKAGQKIAQILIVPVETPEVEEVKDFEPTDGRKMSGWGSTGWGIDGEDMDEFHSTKTYGLLTPLDYEGAD